MLKKIVCLIVAVIMCGSVFAGCNLVTFDQQRDDKKIVITVDSYEIKSPGGDKTYVTEEYNVYKDEFRSLYDYYGYSYEHYYGYTPEQIISLLAEQLAVERIVLNLADAFIDFGYISIDTYEQNTIDQNVYNAIDSAIDTEMHALLEERGEDSESIHHHDDEQENTETTYPTRDESVDIYASMSREELLSMCQQRGLVSVPAQGDDAAQDELDSITVRQLKDMLIKDDRKDVEKWVPSLTRYPGLNVIDEKTRSFELEAFSRALKSIKEAVLSLNSITDDQKAAIEQEYREFENITNTRGLSYVYGALQDSVTAYVYAGESYENQEKMNLIEDYIVGTVEVSRADVEEIYNRTLADQKARFATEANYEAAIDDGEQLLYFPDDNHFFVKHILIPFSDEQADQLESFKNSVENVVESSYNEYRDRLANEIYSYEHVDGEDYGSPVSVNTIYNEIVAKVGAAVTLYEKERAFDDLIYKYNTDPGIFDLTYGYMEKYDLGSSEESYMQEFADAARELYEGGVEGALSGKVVTDYGVHVLYLAKLPKAGEVLGLNDYYSYGRYQSVYSGMEEAALTNKENAAFARWREQQINRYYKGDAENPSVVTLAQKELDSIIA